MSTHQEIRIHLHCHCCGRETLAELVITPKGRKVVIIAQRHGKKHCVALALQGPNARLDKFIKAV